MHHVFCQAEIVNFEYAGQLGLIPPDRNIVPSVRTDYRGARVCVGVIHPGLPSSGNPLVPEGPPTGTGSANSGPNLSGNIDASQGGSGQLASDPTPGGTGNGGFNQSRAWNSAQKPYNVGDTLFSNGEKVGAASSAARGLADDPIGNMIIELGGNLKGYCDVSDIYLCCCKRLS
jgi:hypothetical protein